MSDEVLIESVAKLREIVADSAVSDSIRFTADRSLTGRLKTASGRGLTVTDPRVKTAQAAIA
jgi:hypothetical protein